MMTTKEKKRVPKLRFAGFEGEWDRKQLCEIVGYTKGYAFKSDTYKSKGLRIVRVSDLAADSIKSNNEKLFISEEDSKGLDKYIIKNQDIIITTVGSRPDLVDSAVGRAIFVNKKNEGLLNQNLLKVEQNNRIESKFLFGYLNSLKYRNYINNIQRGNANQSNITVKELLQFKICITSLKEQQKIGTFLTSIDTRIQQLEKKKTLLEQYKEGVMQQIFKQEIRFKDEEGKDFGKWEKKRLGDICSFFSGGTPTSTKRSFYTGNIPFIGSGNISDESVNSFITTEALNSSSAKLVEEGDLLYALYGATSGEVAISKISGAINQAVLCIRTEANKYYLYQLLKYNKGKIVETFIQGGQGNLSAAIIKDLKFHLPYLEEQTKIAHFLTALDTKIAATAQQVEETKKWKKGLLQRMFV